MVIVIMIVIIIDTTWNVTPDIWYILIWSNHIQFPFKNQKHRSSKVAPVFQRPQKWRVNLSCFCQALEKSSRATSIQGSPWWAPCFSHRKSWRKSWKSSGLWSSSFLHRKQIHQMAVFFFRHDRLCVKTRFDCPSMKPEKFMAWNIPISVDHWCDARSHPWYLCRPLKNCRQKENRISPIYGIMVIQWLFMDYDTHDTLQFIGKYNPQTNHQHTLALQTDSMIPL